MNDEIRYYKGKIKVLKLTHTSATKSTLFELLEDGVVGSEKIGFRKIEKGKIINAPVRLCYKNRR